MPTRYNIYASVDGEKKCALHRYSRENALEAVNVLLDAFGEETEIQIEWTLTQQSHEDIEVVGGP